MPGLMNNKNSEDEILLKAIAETNRSNIPNDQKGVHIFDARPQLNAEGNRLKGGGYENCANYLSDSGAEMAQLQFLDIDNIHAVSKTFVKMHTIADSPESFNSIQVYGPKVEDTGYLQLIATILKGVNQIMDSILNKKQNVLIHCSDGWDRTA